MGRIAGDVVRGYQINGKVRCIDGCDRDIDVDQLTESRIITSDQAEA